MSLIYGIRREGGRTDVVVRQDAGVKPLPRAPGYPDPAVAPWDWGHEGPGAQRLAAAILHAALGGCKLVPLYCDDFRSQVVAFFGREGFQILTEEVVTWLVYTAELDLIATRPVNGRAET